MQFLRWCLDSFGVENTPITNFRIWVKNLQSYQLRIRRQWRKYTGKIISITWLPSKGSIRKINNELWFIKLLICYHLNETVKTRIEGFLEERAFLLIIWVALVKFCNWWDILNSNLSRKAAGSRDLRHYISGLGSLQKSRSQDLSHLKSRKLDSLRVRWHCYVMWIGLCFSFTTFSLLLKRRT